MSRSQTLEEASRTAVEQSLAKGMPLLRYARADLRNDGAAGPCSSARIGPHSPCALVLKDQVWPSRPCGFSAGAWAFHPDGLQRHRHEHYQGATAIRGPFSPDGQARIYF